MTSSFDSLFESLLNELSPVTSEYGSFTSSLEKGIENEKTGGYLIKDIADALDITREEAVRKISKDLYDEVFGKYEGGVNPSNNEEEYRRDIATALKDIIAKIKEEHPEASKLKNYEAYRGYTARVISKLADATKDFGETVTKSILKTAVEDATDETEGSTAADEGEEDSQETLTSEFGDQDTLEEPEADTEEESEEEFSDEGKVEPSERVGFSPRVEYFINPEDNIKAGTLSGDLRSVYDKLSGMAGETNSGEDIADRLRKAGIPQNKINTYLKDLVVKSVLEPQEAEGTGGSEALEGGDENMRQVERDTFNRHFSDAYQDYLRSGGGELSGRESNYE
jgi:hypothetical protein